MEFTWTPNIIPTLKNLIPVDLKIWMEDTPSLLYRSVQVREIALVTFSYNWKKGLCNVDVICSRAKIRHVRDKMLAEQNREEFRVVSSFATPRNGVSCRNCLEITYWSKN
jgi:hypothetical protein